MVKSFKYIAFIFIVTALYSCKNDDEDIQYIDQIINLYIKDSSGSDLLKGDSVNTYISYSANDVLGLNANAPVSFSKKIDENSVNFLEYLAGAKRDIFDSINPETKSYRSIIALNFSKKINDTATAVVNDTMKIEYRWTPQVFEVSKIYYNDVLSFTKEANKPNIVTIVK